MANRTPTETTNLDQYGSPAMSWSRPHDILEGGPPEGDPCTHRIYFLGTSRPDGQPHAAAVGAIWHDGDFYFVSGPETRKSRNLAANAACTISGSLHGIDLVFEGEANRVSDPAKLEQVAAIYRAGGWPAEVAGDAFTAPYNAPSAGPPPWHLYRFTFHTAIGVATVEPYGATRWRFAR